MDAQRGILYALGFNFTTSVANLVGFSTATGLLASRTALPFLAEAAFVGVGQTADYDAKTDRVVVSGVMGTGPLRGEFVVLLVNPLNGADYKHVATLKAGKYPLVAVLGAASALDTVARNLFLQIGINNTDTHQVTIDVWVVHLDSAAVDRIPMNPQVGQAMGTLAFSEKLGLLVGLGAAQATADDNPEHTETCAEWRDRAAATLPRSAMNWHAHSLCNDGANTVNALIRTLVSLDPKTKQWKRVGTVPDYTQQAGDVSTLAQGTNVLYAFLNKHGAAPNSFSIVGLDVTDASVVSNAIACATLGGCPWSLEFRN
jgi:hypothetical protein